MLNDTLLEGLVFTIFHTLSDKRCCLKKSMPSQSKPDYILNHSTKL